MDWLRIVFSKNGTLAPREFSTAVLAVYVLLVVAGALIGVIDPSGFAPIFVGILILLIGPALIAVPFSMWTGTRPRLALPLPTTPTPLPAPS